MRPLYQKFYAKQYVAKLSTSDLSISRRRASILSSLQPRIPRCNLMRPDFIVYTDAALLSRRIAGLIMVDSPNGPVVSLLAEAVAPKFLAIQVQQEESHNRARNSSSSCVHPLRFTDFPRKARKLLQRQRHSCKHPYTRRLRRSYHRIDDQSFLGKAERLSLDVWFGRVGSAVNPSDLPTRHKKIPSPILKRVQFNSLFWLMCTTLRDTAV